MDFLKPILGDELYAQIVEKVNAYNGDEAHRESQIKIGNLGGGDYVGKGKHDAIVQQLAGTQSELQTANALIAQLKKGTEGNTELQGKITQYETTVADLQRQLQETKIKAAVKVALLAEKAQDVDYLTYKIEEKLRAEGRAMELDDNDAIKGWADMIAGLKTQFPGQFEAASGSDIQANPLPEGDDRKTEPTTLADALRMQAEGQ